MRQAVIIGAGFGSLSCAITLAAKGWKVTVLERQAQAGGKLQPYEEAGYQFDRGPSTITMPHAFRSIYEQAGACMEDYVELYELEPRTRNIFADGTIVDLTSDRKRMAEQLAAYSPRDAAHYPAFAEEAAKLYRLAEKQFLSRLLLDWREKASLPLLRDLIRVRPFLTLDRLLKRYFQHPHTLALFGRYATYVGSSPYQAPSIFAMLAQVEGEEGVYGVRGGTYQLIRGLVRLAGDLGVELVTRTEATAIVVRDGRVTGVDTTRGFYPAGTVIAGGDVLSVNRLLLPEQERPSMSDKKIASYEPSLSGFVTLAGVPRQYKQLLHHTVFFPEHYQPELTAIFKEKQPPADPTLYLCYSGHSEPERAPKGASNLFILANAPYVNPKVKWREEAPAYGQRILHLLGQRGITGLEQSEVLVHYTPEDIERDTLAHRGAIYGISSNSARQTFFRPGNRSSDVQGLWYVGGTTHPGGGTPIVSMSGRLVGERIASEDC